MSKLFSADKMILIGILVVSVMFVVYYSSSKSLIVDRMEDGSAKYGPKQKKQPGVRETNAQYVVPAPETAPGYAQQPVAKPSELLPQDNNSQWAALNPSALNQGGMPDLLQSGYFIGLDTIGQSLKNANLQLRSDPIIPKQDVGPWNHSTIEPDLGRVPLEIGVGCQ
uniref:Minor capsid protein P11 C-terminal conserved region domain-containing protein n=1 Tax=viral metagenome TaxID=1070528 RepID=A0A6C0HHM4_9ZZZZ